VVAGAAIAAHARGLRYGLLGWDDVPYVLEAPHLGLDARTVRWAFGTFHAAYWLPLTWLSYALDATVWGLDGPGFHLTNVVLHAANAVLVGALAARLLRLRARSGAAWGRADVASAVLAGMFWAVHPLRVESVAWVAERKDVLSGLLFLLALHAWLGAVAPRSGAPVVRPRLAWYAGALAATVLAVLAKGTAMVIPAVLLLLDGYPLRRWSGLRTSPRLVAEKLPFIGVALAGAIMTLLAQRPAMWSGSIDTVTRLLVAAKALAVYILRTAWPVGLSPFYVHPGRVGLESPAYLAATVAVLVATALAWSVRRREPGWLALWGWHVVACLPVLGFVQVGLQETADRHTYLAGIAPAILLGVLARSVSERSVRDARFARTWGAALATACVVVLAALGVASWRQTGFWSDDLALWTRVLELDPDAGVAYLYRSKALEASGDREGAVEDLGSSIAVAERKGYYRLGELFAERARLLALLGRCDEARCDVERARSLPPLSRGAEAMLDETLRDVDEGLDCGHRKR
jgi:hypothetical protein